MPIFTMNKFKISNLKLKKILLVFSSLYVLLFMFYVSSAHAQIGSVGLANYLPINSSKIEDGDIIVATPKGYLLSSVEYDPQTIGVVDLKPAVALKTSSNEKTYPVVASGSVLVKVSKAGGNIKKGDFITTSNIKGAGMKATKSGFVIGQAMENASFGNSKIVTVTVILNMQTLQSGSAITNAFLDIFHLSKIATYETPSKVVQYVVAAFITIASFACGFLIFAKAVNTGLEALGRNPLAGRMIQISIVFNLILIVVIIVAGVALSYLVLRL